MGMTRVIQGGWQDRAASETGRLAGVAAGFGSGSGGSEGMGVGLRLVAGLALEVRLKLELDLGLGPNNRCQKEGHIARNCPKLREADPSLPTSIKVDPLADIEPKM